MAIRFRHYSVPLLRCWRATGIAVCLSNCAAPTPPTVGGADGWDTLPPTAEAPPTTTRDPGIEGPLRRWVDADQLPKLKTLGGRTRSEHLGGHFERTVSINFEAESYTISASSLPMPVGALIAQHHHRRGHKESRNTFIMIKKSAGYAPKQHNWQFLVLDSKQRLLAEGKLPRCARCHLEAPHDGLFGPPTRTP